MCKLIHDRCKLRRKLIIKTAAACVYANDQSVLDVILCFISEDYTKTMIRPGSVDIGECSPMFTSPSANNC